MSTITPLATRKVVLYSEPALTDAIFEEQILGESCEVLRYAVSSLKEIPVETCARVDGLMLFRHWASADDLRRFTNLKAVVRTGVGLDRVDEVETARRGIVLCNVPDYGVGEIADHAIALVLSLTRGISLYTDIVRSETPTWSPVECPAVRRMDGARLGVLGLGRIGTATALRAKAFGCEVVFHDPYVARGIETVLGFKRVESLDELLLQSEILSIHVPLTDKTRNLIGLRELECLPRGAIVINTARGAVLDLQAAGEALRSGTLAGLGLDVIPVEPPVEPFPELLRAYKNRESWLRGRFVLTPHVAFNSPASKRDLHRKAVETMYAALFTDRPRNVVTLNQN
jgi:phosphoglycerate dehydrogenase-like enzyme